MALPHGLVIIEPGCEQQWFGGRGLPVDERFGRDASGRLTFDLPGLEAADYPAVSRGVVDAFALTPDNPLVVGLNEMFADFRRGEQVIGLEWDIWMGFTVVAKSEASTPLVRDIAAWLSTSRWLGPRSRPN